MMPVNVRSSERCASPPASVNTDAAKYVPHATCAVAPSAGAGTSFSAETLPDMLRRNHPH
jgi:hypothetical protein